MVIAGGARALLLVLLLLVTAAPVAAQMRGAIGVGAEIGFIRPTADELDTDPRFRPTLRRMPSHGWGFAFALNWYGASVSDPSVVEGHLGRVAIRPLMVGIGYTAVSGRWIVSPSFVAGPSLNTLTLDDRVKDQIAITGNKFEEKVGTIAVAVRPGVSVTYALAPRFGLTGFGGYLFNRPAFAVRTPAGEVRTRWSTDGLVLNGGIVVSLF